MKDGLRVLGFRCPTDLFDKVQKLSGTVCPSCHRPLTYSEIIETALREYFQRIEGK